ncbi:MAG: tetratricopeptide repeat protein, partial [Myxococcota bacterium]
EYWWPRPVLWLQGFTRFLEGCAGQPSESLAGLEQLLRLAQSRDSALAQAILHYWATHQAELLGDSPGAMAHARRCGEIVEDFAGAGPSPPLGDYSLGIAHLLDDNSREAVSYLERAAAIHEETGGAPFEAANSLSRLAVAYADLGQPERARETAARGLALVRERRLPVLVALALIMQVQVLRKTQGAEAREAIEAALAEAEALVESTGIRSWQPFIHVERAELARLVGDETTRERELREAHRRFTDMGAAAHAERVARALS